MVIRIKYLVFLLFLPWHAVFCQSLFPDAGPVFDDRNLAKVYITIDQADLEAIYASPDSYVEYPATFRFERGALVFNIDLVGFRLRGNTSRYSAKKSFKVSFNSFIAGQQFFGLDKMNLNGEHNDPSVMRAKLGWEICREMGVPASRANHVLLYINDQFWGIYINVEHVDEEFVKLRFGEAVGNLYKCLWPADMVFRGYDPEAYKMVNGNRRAYDLRTNVEADDYSDLAALINVLNNTPIDQRQDALDVFTANWDGPLYNKNNFYLYHNPQSDKFEYIPYDLDNTFGIDWFNIDWASRDIFNWSPDWEPRPLYENVLEVPAFKSLFVEEFNALLTELSLNRKLHQTALHFRDQIAPFVADDPFYAGDYGWDYSDFIASYQAPLPANHVTMGLLPYIDVRTQTALNQLITSGRKRERIAENDIKIYPNPCHGVFHVDSDESGQLHIYDSHGVLINSVIYPGRHTQISLNVPAGIYYIKLITDTHRSVLSRMLVM